MMRWIVVIGLWCCLGMTGCKDTTRACQQAARKYMHCMKEAHKQALKQKNAARSKKLLKQIGKRLQSKDWETRYLKLCRQRPPTMKQLRCVKSTPCNRLSVCQKRSS